MSESSYMPPHAYRANFKGRQAATFILRIFSEQQPYPAIFPGRQAELQWTWAYNNPVYV